MMLSGWPLCQICAPLWGLFEADVHYYEVDKRQLTGNKSRMGVLFFILRKKTEG